MATVSYEKGYAAGKVDGSEWLRENPDMIHRNSAGMRESALEALRSGDDSQIDTDSFVDGYFAGFERAVR